MSFDFHGSVNPHVATATVVECAVLRDEFRKTMSLEMKVGDIERRRHNIGFDNRSAITRIANYDFDR